MAFNNDQVFDQGLDWAVANGTRLHLLSADPGGTYATVTANDLGNAAVTQTKADGETDGRSTVVPETTVTPSGTGTATHWATTNNSNTVVSSGALSSNISLTNGVGVTIAEFQATKLRDAA